MTSPEMRMNPQKRSPLTFLQWFSNVIQVDFSDKPEVLRAYFKEREGIWFSLVHDAFASLLDEYPGGFSIPDAGSPRPLLWHVMDTAGTDHAVGGVGTAIPFFGPLVYPGVIITEPLHFISRVQLGRTSEQVKSSPTYPIFLQFIDLLIDYLPLIQAGRIAIISDHVAYGIAKPPYPHSDWWVNDAINQDMLTRMGSGEDVSGSASIPTLVGYLNLVEAFNADPVISERHQSTADLLYDYVSSAGYDSPRKMYSTLPKLNFAFYLDRTKISSDKRDRAKQLADLVDDPYWQHFRAAFTSASARTNRADFVTELAAANDELHKAYKASPAFLRHTASFLENAGNNFLVAGGVSLASFVGFEGYRQLVDQNLFASVLSGAGIATGASYAGRKALSRLQKPFVAPDVLILLSHAIRDPEDGMTDAEKVRRAHMIKLLKKNSA